MRNFNKKNNHLKSICVKSMQNLLEKVGYIIIVGAFKRDLLLS